MAEEETVTITKVQLRKLVDAVFYLVPDHGLACAMCDSLLDEDGHTPDCELPALKELCK